MHRKIVFPLFVLLFTAFAAFAVSQPQWKWRQSKYCRITEHAGKKLLTVAIPADAPEISRRNTADTPVGLTRFEGQPIEFSIRLRNSGISRPDNLHNGIKFQLYFRDGNGTERWTQAEIPHEPFPWRRFRFSERIPAGATSGTLRLGLQGSSGNVEFDLDSLQIRPLAPELSPAPPTPEQIRECELIESRLRADLSAKQPLPGPEVKELLARQNGDGTFRDVDYSDRNRSVWQTATHLKHAFELALARATPGHALYRDPAAGEAVRKAVAWWAEKQPQNGNWWWNDMYVPKFLGNILLLSPDLFPDGPPRRAALNVCRQACFLSRYTGNNRVFIAANIFCRALLERNLPVMDRAAAVLSEEIRFAPAEHKTAWSFGGIRADGCYHQHGPQIQFGNYGGEFLANIAYWSNILKETHWELSPEQWRIMRHLTFNGFQWVLWRGRMDLLACGRQLGRNAAETKGERTLNAFAQLRNADPGDRAPYDAALRRNRDGENTLTGNRHFWNSDYMVHRRPTWYASVRMNSVRVRPIEDDTNWDNALGRYFSDGACLVMRSGKEYENITACWDWTRLPGTTLPKTPVYTGEDARRFGLKIGGGDLPRWTHSRNWRQLGETGFVGGVTDGERGAAVYTQDLDGVRARKAWFFDRDAIYCLGSGITSSSPYEVATTVNSSLRNGEIQQGDGWFRHDGIGYRGENLKLTAGPRTGDWRYVEGGLTRPVPETKELFTLTVEHGVKPRNASYIYTILPGATPEETAGTPPGRVLRNTPECQAVEFADGVRAAIFYEPGRLDDFETDTPGAFLIGKGTVHAADPTGRHSSFTLKLNGVSRKVPLPAGEFAGQSVKIVLK